MARELCTIWLFPIISSPWGSRRCITCSSKRVVSLYNRFFERCFQYTNARLTPFKHADCCFHAVFTLWLHSWDYLITIWCLQSVKSMLIPMGNRSPNHITPPRSSLLSLVFRQLPVNMAHFDGHNDTFDLDVSICEVTRSTFTLGSTAFVFRTNADHRSLHRDNCSK